MVTWLHYFWAVARQNYHGGEHMAEQCCLLHGGQETERDRKGPGQDLPFKGTTPVTYFLQAVPASEKPVYNELISGLAH
jgi:hypothetical protein